MPKLVVQVRVEATVLRPVEVQPGDILLVTTPGQLGEPIADLLKEALIKALGVPDLRVVVLEEGLRLEGVLRRVGVEDEGDGGDDDETAA